MRRTLVALAAAVCLSTPAFAQSTPWYSQPTPKLDFGPDPYEIEEYSQRESARTQQRVRDHNEWLDRQLDRTLRNHENRRQEWNRWQDNMRSDDGRQQSWDTPYYKNW